MCPAAVSVESRRAVDIGFRSGELLRRHYTEVQQVIASPVWRSWGGQRSAQMPRPTFVSLWNWMGLIAHGGYFAVVPVWDSIPIEVRTYGLAVLAFPLFLGHFMFWHARRLKGRGVGC